MDHNILDAALSSGNKRLILDALQRHLDIRLASARRKIYHIGSQRPAYPDIKKTSLVLSESATQGIKYDKLKFDIITPINFDSMPAYRSRTDYDIPNTFSNTRLSLLQAMQSANVRRCEIINCFRTVNGDHKQGIQHLYHSVDPSDMKSFEPNGPEEIESRIAKDSQGAGATSPVN